MQLDFGALLRFLLPESRAAETAAIFRRVLETGESHEVAEDAVPDSRGNENTYYEWRVDRIPLPDGTNGVVCYFRDISQAVKVRQAYRQLTKSLEAEVRTRTSELEKRNLEVLAQSELVREFSQRLLQAQDAERRHIARELHDSAGQTLTVLGIQEASIAERLRTELPDLLKEMEEVQNLTLQLNQEIRTASYLLHPPMLDETGLAGALQWYVDGFNTRSGIEITLDVDLDFPRFPADIELALFRIVQEALTNTHRHSGSKKGLIRINQNDGEIQLEVQDLGKGIPSEKLREIRSGGAGVGFRRMRERVHQLHGRFNVESDSSETRVSVVLPRPDEESKTLPGEPDRFPAKAG
jgi:signal transduction histidine kinase